MKPDMKYFKVLKDPANYQAWKEHTYATCRGTGLGAVCDFTYTATPYEFPSFVEKCKYMFTVLYNNVKTVEGISIVRRNLDRQDGRRVLYELDQEYATSTTADVRASDLLGEITTISLDRSWTKTVLEFIVYLEDLMINYNELMRNPSQKLSPDMMRSFFERAVHKVRALHDVKQREREQMIRYGDAARLRFEDYMYLLKEAAKAVDRERSVRSRRQANVMEITDGSDDEHMEEFNQFQAWKAQQSPAARIENDVWASMDNNSKKSWTSISAKDRAAILESTKQERKVNFADSQSQSDNEEEEEQSEEVPPSDDDGPKMEANATKTIQEANEAKGNAHPGDLRRVLSKKPSATPKEKTKVKQYNVNWVNPGGRTSIRKQSSPAASSSGTKATNTVSTANTVLDSIAEYWGEQEDQFFG